ncbi:hypothetical protein [Alicyclobacillus ferrooxydans]|uniref:Copper amine oxidase-like N-terminal domain-containing protein n=1 Tax=Alicyclobacillus ferrooxydans TaxID=471514 RepID=A0A0P9E9A0_9BACL|nr:hypothetical protein [Alicyclobacillus ferrooxydans]KPV38944.1 hypothetical protein AN477_23165 [Alicyclobacillus ferrooxydans]
MKLNRYAVSGLVLAGVTLASGLAAVPAMAAIQSGNTMAATHIYLNGQNVSNPEHVIAKDPWGGSKTTWVPVYYLQQVLTKAGFQTSWNGTSLTFVSDPSGWVTGAALGNPEAQPLTAPKGQMQVTLVSGSAPSMNIPKLVAKDPASGVKTTYVPIYYIDQVLNQYWMMHATWNGSDWQMVTQQNSPITEQSYPTSSEALNAVTTIESNFSFMKFNASSVNLGDGITAQSDVSTGKQGNNGLQWHEGNWTIDVLYYTNNEDGEQVAKNVVSYLHTHMLPAPRTKGVIVVESTNSNVSALTGDTTIAWQEGNKVYQLQRPGDPVRALEAVVNSNK